jgi:LysM repeat protein
MGIAYMKHLKLFIFLCILTFTVSCGQQKRYIQYKVEKGETITTIAQKLKMETKDLIRLNPDVVGQPSANSYIVVPEKKLESFKEGIKKEKNYKPKIENEIEKDSINTPSDKVDVNKVIDELNREFEIYEVKKGDTFYNINKRFSVSRGELLLLNPELIEGLKLGQILKLREIIKEVKLVDVVYDDYLQSGIKLKASILLPFRANNKSFDTLNTKEIFGNQGDLMNLVTDFYLGAEMAVDSLRSQGVNIELNVFDTGNRRSNNINKIITGNKLQDNNVIIGPLYSENLQLVANNVDVPIVFPVFSKSQNQFTRPNIIKTAPDVDVFRNKLTEYFKMNFTEGNIIIVTDNDFSSIQESRIIKQELENLAMAAKVHILSPTKGYIKKERFLNIMQPDMKNWVIFATDKYLTISDAINSLISLPENTTVKGFSFDSGKSYKKIDHRKLAQIGFTFVTDEFIDETSISSRHFSSQYKRKNKALPSFYAIKGFDITYDILARLASGNELKTTFNNGVSLRVDSKFDYAENRYSVYENRSAFLIQYNKDLTLTKIE